MSLYAIENAVALAAANGWQNPRIIVAARFRAIVWAMATQVVANGLDSADPATARMLDDQVDVALLAQLRGELPPRHTATNQTWTGRDPR